DVEWDALAGIVELAVANGEDLALLRLLLGGVGKDEAASGLLLLLDGPHDQTIAQGLESHAENLRLECASGRAYARERLGVKHWHSQGPSANCTINIYEPWRSSR